MYSANNICNILFSLIISILYNTYRNIINIVIKYDSLNYIGQDSSKSKYIYNNYELFLTNINFATTKVVFEHTEMSSKNQ